MATSVKSQKKVTPNKSPKKATSKKVQKPTLAAKLSYLYLNKKVRIIIAVIFIASASGIGAYVINRSNAATDQLSALNCNLRGRKYNSTSGLCTDVCATNAGTYNTTTEFGYCTRAVTVGMSHEDCNSIGRRYIEGLGCSKRWQGDNSAPSVLQCLNSSSYYIVQNTVDYCTGYSSSIVSAGWSWPAQAIYPGPCWNKYISGLGHHAGMDMNTRATGVSAVAAHSGTVYRKGYDGAAGNYVIVKVKSDLYYVYEHLASISVSSGQSVTGGSTKIGVIGKTGRVYDVQYGHLHMGISVDGGMGSYSNNSNTRDPLDYLPKPAPNNYYCTSN